MVPPFQYVPLAPEEVRVIRIHGRPSDSPSDLKASLLHAPISSHFECLSYVWGHNEKSHVLLVNGDSLPITRSLYDALSHFASLACRFPVDEDLGSSLTPPIWIDAVSINQDDDAEKSRQVQIMDRIYTGRGVYAWLGPDDDECAVAITFLKTLKEQVESGGVEKFVQADAAASVFSRLAEPCVKMLRSYLFDEHDQATPQLRAIQRFFSSSYWSRTWIIQEVMLAGDVTFSCGGSFIGREALRMSMFMLAAFFPACRPARACCGDNIEKIPMSASATLGMWGDADVNTVMKALCVCQISMGPYDLEDRKKLSGVAATDPRDYIFGMAGILNQDFTRLGINVDYSLTVQEVFSAFASAYLEAHGDLELLGFSQFPKRTQGLPTWVPDWSMGIAPPLCLTAGQAGFKACRTRKSSLLISRDPWTLHIVGSRIGRVCRLVKSPMDDLEAEVHMVLRDLYQMLDEWQGPSPYPSSSAKEEALWRTAIADAESVEFLDNHNVAQETEQRTRATERMRNCFNVLQNFVGQKIANPDYTPDRQTEDELVAYTLNAGIAMLFRRAFMSDSGHIGLGPTHMLEGDLVAVFAGATTPSILRPCSLEGFEYVGEAYVHGLMDGEDESQAAKEMQSFSIA